MPNTRARSRERNRDNGRGAEGNEGGGDGGNPPATGTGADAGTPTPGANGGSGTDGNGGQPGSENLTSGNDGDPNAEDLVPDLAKRLAEAEQRIEFIENFMTELTDDGKFEGAAIRRLLTAKASSQLGGSSGHGGSTNNRWVWKEMSYIGEDFFDLLDHPENNQDFKDFVLVSGEARLEEVPPWQARLRVIKSHPITKDVFQRIRTALVEGGRVPTDGGVLTELAALYLGSSDEGMNPIPLRTFLAMGRTTRERARGYPKESFMNAKTDSVVSSAVKERLVQYAWAQGSPVDVTILSGEDIQSVPHYRRTMELSRAAQLCSENLAELHQKTQASASQVGVPTMVGTNVSMAGRSAVGTMMRREKRPRQNPFGVSGSVYVGDRCGKCGRVGHSFKMCLGPAHPAASATHPQQLLNEMSHGRVALP